MSVEGEKKQYRAGELRERMPEITAWLDGLRSAFGADCINQAVRRGIAGRPTFHAAENGIEVGTPRPTPYGTCSCDAYLRLLELERMERK